MEYLVKAEVDVNSFGDPFPCNDAESGPCGRLAMCVLLHCNPDQFTCPGIFIGW